MKRFLLSILLIAFATFGYAQTTYYWVGQNNDSINVLSNWNTSLDGSGSFRSSNSTSTDILVFDNVSLSGNPFTVGSSGAVTCGQLKYVNGSNVNMVRTTSGGTTVITVAGGAGDDFFVDATSKAGFTSTAGSMRIDMGLSGACTGRVDGEMRTVTSQQFRLTNTTTGAAGSMIFSSGSKFYTNITGSSSYAFGSSTQASEGWVIFEAGASLYYDGGNSPHGSGSGFSAIDMKPGSTWHHRATNTASTAGNFFNRKSYGDVIVENSSTLLQNGTVNRIEDLTITAGSSFMAPASGLTVVLGNIVADGDILFPVGSTNRFVLAGNGSISGTGTASFSNLTIANDASISLNKNISVESEALVIGKLNFGTSQLSGSATFAAYGIEPDAAATGNMVAGNYFITGNNVYTSAAVGKHITGTGIAPKTSVVAYSSTLDTLYLSQPVTGSGAAVGLTLSTSGATLETNNPNGFSPLTGSVLTLGNQTYNDNINYIIDAATNTPFGVTTGGTGTPILAKFIEVNAPITVNRSFTVSDHLTIEAKITLRPLDVIHLMPGAVINGSVGASNYIVTSANATTGEQSFLTIDGINGSTLFPIGSASNYLPLNINPSATSDFMATVFEGITSNGTVNGTALSTAQKLRLVDAVWNVSRPAGSGTAEVQLSWPGALEGSTFTTLPSSDLGLIINDGTSWSMPTGTGDNSLNTVTATLSSFGSLAIGAVPPSQPFTFNPIPDHTYGEADFNAGASSLNTTQPINYSSSNTSVATIVAGNVHIVGAGTTTITAMQSTDGIYPAANVSQPLTVNKAELTIKADDQLKFANQPNPSLTLSYSGFVNGETPTVLMTQPTVTTTATTSSPAGTYPITVSGATAANYNISFVNGVLTVQPQTAQTITFNALPTKTYGNSDFAAGASSTNNTIPITYSSSNPSVATVNASGIIHITGGGTTTITASQAGNAGYFPAADVARTLTVNKAALTMRVLDTVKVQGQPNPDFILTYTGFVLGETAANLATAPTIGTIATIQSPAGYYPLTPGGAVTNNYNITYVAGRLTIYPPNGKDGNHIHAFMSSGTALTVRVYSTFPDLGDVTLYDLSGKPLMKRNMFMPQGFANVDLDVSTIPAGIYVVTARGHVVNLKKTIAIIR